MSSTNRRLIYEWMPENLDHHNPGDYTEGGPLTLNLPDWKAPITLQLKFFPRETSRSSNPCVYKVPCLFVKAKSDLQLLYFRCYLKITDTYKNKKIEIEGIDTYYLRLSKETPLIIGFPKLLEQFWSMKKNSLKIHFALEWGKGNKVALSKGRTVDLSSDNDTSSGSSSSSSLDD